MLVLGTNVVVVAVLDVADAAVVDDVDEVAGTVVEAESLPPHAATTRRNTTPTVKRSCTPTSRWFFPGCQSHDHSAAALSGNSLILKGPHTSRIKSIAQYTCGPSGSEKVDAPVSRGCRPAPRGRPEFAAIGVQGGPPSPSATLLASGYRPHFLRVSEIQPKRSVETTTSITGRMESHFPRRAALSQRLRRAPVSRGALGSLVRYRAHMISEYPRSGICSAEPLVFGCGLDAFIDDACQSYRFSLGEV